MNKLGKYEILERLGSGGMGVVYKARDPFMERVVALKTMAEDLDAEPQLRERFYREAQSAGKLNHKNIVTIYDLGEEGKTAYIAMEYLDGEDLKSKIDRRVRIPLEDRLRLILEVCDGLSHAHKKGVIHRDIKPGNIHITLDGHVKIMDFGLARIASSNITKTGIALGTPNYMSPEQAKGDRVDHRADIFSVGAVFYELLSNRKPFDPQSSYDWRQVFFRVIFEEPEPIENFLPNIPEELAAVVRRAMAKDPSQRYGDIDEMSRDLVAVRRSLEERRVKLHQEVQTWVAKLDELIENHREVLREDLERDQATEETAVHLGFGQGYLDLAEMRERIERDYQRYRAIVERRDRRQDHLDRIRSLEHDGRLDEAVRAAEQWVTKAPGDVEVASLLERLRARRDAEEEAARVVAERIAAARRLLSQGGAEEALAQVQEALAVKPDHQEAAALEAEIAYRLAEQERERRAGELVAEATLRLNRADLEGCLAALARALELRPDDETAKALHRNAQQQKEELEREHRKRQEAEGALTAARRSMEADDIEGARQALERARVLAPDLAAVSELSDALDRAETAGRLSRLVEAAASLEASGNDEAALDRIGQALALDEHCQPALDLQAKVERRRKERARRKAALERAAALVESGDADDLAKAVELVEGVLREEPSLQEARELRAALETEKRERRVSRLVSEARALDGTGKEQEAESRLDEALKLVPDHPDALMLRLEITERRESREQAERDRREKLARALEEARGLQAQGAIEPALRLVQSAVADDPSSDEARRLLKDLRAARQERERRLADQVKQARAQDQAGEEEQALDLLGAVVAEAPQHKAAIELKTVIEERRAARARERQEKVHALVEEARRAETEGDYERTIVLSQEALGEDASHREATAMLERAEAAQENRRLETEARDLIGRAEALAASGDPGGAIALLDRAPPDVAALAQVRKTREVFEQAVRALERAKRVEQLMAEGRESFAEGRYASIEPLMKEVLSLDANQEDAAALLATARQRLEEQQKQERLAREREAALRSAEGALGRGDLDSAERELKKAAALDESDEQLQPLRDRLHREREERRARAERQKKAHSLVVRAEDLLKQKEAAGALDLVGQAQALVPDLAEAARLKKRIEKRITRGEAQPLPMKALYAAGGLLLAGAMAWGLWKLVRPEDTKVSTTSTAVVPSPPTSVVDVQPTTSALEGSSTSIAASTTLPVAPPTSVAPTPSTTVRPTTSLAPTTTVAPTTTAPTTTVAPTTSLAPPPSTSAPPPRTSSVRPPTTTAPQTSTGPSAADLLAVREVVLGGYKTAMESRDAAALKRLWPGMPGDFEQQLVASFRMTRTLAVDLSCQEPAIEGDRARLQCQRVIRYEFTNGDRRSGESSNTFDLRRRGGSWVLENIR